MRITRQRVAGWAWGALLPLLPLCPAAANDERPPGGALTFEISAQRYRFEPSSIEVRAGDRVRLLLHSLDTTHGLEIEGLGLEVVIPKGGEVVSVEFVAGGPGRYEMKCSEYCGSGHRRMKGEFVVREAGS